MRSTSADVRSSLRAGAAAVFSREALPAMLTVTLLASISSARVHGDALRRCSLARRLRPFRHAQQDLRVGVFQKEGEFILAIARV